jgi:hypothetical protein
MQPEHTHDRPNLSSDAKSRADCGWDKALHKKGGWADRLGVSGPGKVCLEPNACLRESVSARAASGRTITNKDNKEIPKFVVVQGHSKTSNQSAYSYL